MDPLLLRGFGVLASSERFVSRWLTDMQCQKVLEEREAEPEPKPDEDGPPSSEDAEERSTSDESAGSEDDPPEKPHGAIYGGYFE